MKDLLHKSPLEWTEEDLKKINDQFEERRLQAEKDNAVQAALEVLLEDIDHKLLSKFAGYVERYCKNKQQKFDDIEKERFSKEMQDYLQAQGDDFVRDLQKQNHSAKELGFSGMTPEIKTTLDDLRASKELLAVEEYVHPL
jgi:hypothetical protein